LYQAFALAVVVLMVASMVGYSFLTEPNTTPTDDIPPSDLGGPQIDQTQIKSFYAEEIDANVVQLFPVMVLTASTEETEINLIDAAIYALPGVTSVNSYYKTDQLALTGGLVYVATISFDPAQDKEELLQGIKDNTSLQVADVVQTGLVKVPVETRLKAEDDETLFKDYRLEEPFLEAILSFETAKDDKIVVSEQFVFSGDQIMQSLAFETANKTGQPTSFGLKLPDIEIVELTKRFTLGGSRIYQGANDFDWLEQKIEALAEVDSVELEVQPIFYRLGFIIDKNLSGRVLTDLNAALNQVESAKAVKFWHQEDVDIVTVDFEAQADYEALKDGVEQAFASSGAEYQERQEPMVSLFGELETKTTQSLDLNESFFELMAAEGFQGIELYQEALVDLKTKEFVGPDILLSWQAEETTNQALIFPGHEVGQRVELDVSIYGERGKVTRINAFESK
jgi:hypothetical protein